MQPARKLAVQKNYGYGYIVIGETMGMILLDKGRPMYMVSL